MFFYNTVVAQAYRVEVTPSRITFAFLANQRVPKQQCEEMKAFLEEIAQKVSGTKIPVMITSVDAAAAPPRRPAAALPSPAATSAAVAPVPDEETLRKQAMSDPSVQALFEIFPVEKSKVEEM